MNLLLVRVCILKPKYGWIRTLFWKKQQHNFSCISVLEYCHMNIFFSIHLLPCLTNQLRDKNFIFQLFLHAFQINIYIWPDNLQSNALMCLDFQVEFKHEIVLRNWLLTYHEYATYDLETIFLWKFLQIFCFYF